jgi:hypothetical protein
LAKSLPELAIPVIRKKLPKAKIILFSDDIHHLRQRQIEDSGCSANCWESLKRREMEIYPQSDLVLAISRQDQETFQKMIGHQSSTVVDIFPFTEEANITELVVPKFGQRSGGLLYLGSKHEANVMTVKYILNEIFPEARKLVPGLTLTLVGASKWRRLARKIPGVRAYGKVGRFRMIRSQVK